MKKNNFRIDSDSKTVLVEISPRIFPISTILNATYRFIDEAKVAVEEKGKKILVTFVLEKDTKEADLERLAYEFNLQLIASFAEEEESKKYSGTRDAFMKAALLQQPPNS
jgi:His-Xaa-Ser system protein HxsD